MSDHKNPYPGEHNTGHFWDDEHDLRELDNRPPRWYMMALYISLAIIIGYVIYYPSIPWFNDYTKGVAGWSQISEYKEDLKKLEDYRKNKFHVEEGKIKDLALTEILKDNELTTYAVKTVKTTFGDNCAACHGGSGQGSNDFPILLDDDWLYGGKINAIYTSIKNGRKGNMPAHKMSEADLNTLTNLIYNTNTKQKVDPTAKATYFKKGCVGCHLPTMTGLAPLGAANLADSIWRFGADDEAGLKASIKHTITHGVNQKGEQSREAIMPVFGKKLDDTTIKKLAIFVHQLGGGK